MFLVAGAVLLVIVALLWGNATRNANIFASPAPGKILNITGLQQSFAAGEGRPLFPQLGNAHQNARAQLNGDAIARSTSIKRGKVINQLQLLASQQHNTDLHDLLLYSALALAFMAMISILLGWLTAGRVLRPLRTITGAAQRISASNLHERLALEGPDDELRALGDTIDQLLGRLERSFQAQRQFVANASHELRTPLATMRASVDVALAKPQPIPEQTRNLASHIGEELDQVDRLIENFLALARAQAGPLGGDAAASLDSLVGSALRAQAGPISEQDLDVNDDGLAHATVCGNETLITRMVENVIDNAVRHNTFGGWIRVRTEVEQGMAVLTVENGGPVLDDETVSDLVVPFRRLEAERTRSDSGFGLGLSIVSTIAETHGGHLELHARQQGGFNVRIELPAVLAVPGGVEV